VFVDTPGQSHRCHSERIGSFDWRRHRKNCVGGGTLNGPLGLTVAPNGNILTVNARRECVETTTAGSQVAVKTIDTSGQGAGTLFGLAITPNGSGVYFVDDGDNTLDLLH
jgi:hypothetical protein